VKIDKPSASERTPAEIFALLWAARSWGGANEAAKLWDTLRR